MVKKEFFFSKKHICNIRKHKITGRFSYKKLNRPANDM